MKNEISLIPMNIEDAIGYSPGSIVSKIILKSQKLQITIFAVAQGESFAEHTTSKKAIVHILAGEGEFKLKDRWHKFKERDYFYMEEGLKHAIKSKTDFKFLLYLFN